MTKQHKGKVPGIHMSGNGNGPEIPGIPPDVEWDEENPPFIYPCSQNIEHDPNCTQENCVGEVSTETQIALHNEGKAWARAGMNPQVISPDPLGVACQVNALQIILVQHGIVDQNEIDEEYRRIRLDIMQSIRAEMQPQVEAARREAAIGIKKSRIIGPHGELL